MPRARSHTRSPRPPLVLALLALLTLLALPALARAEPAASAASMAERVRQIKQLQAQLMMSERWESEHAGGRFGEIEHLWDTSIGGPCADCPGGASGLAQRPAPWSPESAAPAARAWRLAPPLAGQGELSYARNVLVNDPSLDDDNKGDAQSEPGVAAWGRYVIAAWNDGRGQTPNPSLVGFIGYSYSTDGGQTFIQGPNGGVPPSTLGGGVWTSDPVVTVNEKTGDFYFCGLYDPFSDTEDLAGVAVARANFIGTTLVWSTPRVVRALPGGITSVDVDKPWIAADSVSGNVYLTYTRYLGAFDDSILFSRSTDRGVTWSPSTTLSSGTASGAVQGSRPAVGPGGEVYAVWKELGPFNGNGQDFMRIRKSTDFGVSFGPEQTAAAFFDNFGTGAPSFNREQGIALPSISVDRTGGTRRGRVYVAWNESVNFYDSIPDTVPVLIETEPNGDTASAQPFEPGVTLVGGFGDLGDFDYYRFDAVQGTSYVFWTDRIGARYTMRVLGTDGITRLAFSGTPRNLPAGQGFIVWTCPVSGRYFFRMVTAGFETSAYRVRTGIDIRGGPFERARDQRDVFVASSGDPLAATWTTPTLVHPDQAPWFDDWLPEVTVAGASSIYAAWYDWSDSPPALCGGQSQLYMARSDDGGATWASMGPVSDQFADWGAAHSNITPNQGDYIGLFATANTIIPVWTAPPLNGTPDIYAAPFALNALQIYIESVTVDTSVVLTWRARGTPPPTANVYRAVSGQGYSLVGTSSFDGAGRIGFDDFDIQEGTQYRYALGVVVGGTEQVVGERTVNVPGKSQPQFTFMGAKPNPTHGTLVVSLALPDSKPAELALYDLFGREIRKMTVQGAGPHEVNLGQGLYLESGLYFIHLSQGGQEATRRVSVVR